MRENPFELEELNRYISVEGQSVLQVLEDITEGYRCIVTLSGRNGSATGMIDLYSVEQAKAVVLEILRQQVRLIAAELANSEREKKRQQRKKEGYDR